MNRIDEDRLFRERGEAGAPEYRPRPWPPVVPLAKCSTCGHHYYTASSIIRANLEGCECGRINSVEAT